MYANFDEEAGTKIKGDYLYFLKLFNLMKIAIKNY